MSTHCWSVVAPPFWAGRPVDPHCPSQSPALFAFPLVGSASASTRSSRDRPAAASTLLHCAGVVPLGPWPGPGPGHVASGCFPGLWSSCDAKQVSVLRHPCCAVSGTGLRAPCTHRPAGPAQWAHGRARQPFCSQGMQRAHHDILYTNRKTIGSANGTGSPLRYYTALGCDCEAVCVKMLGRLITWIMLPVKC